MKLWPWESFEIETAMTVDDAVAALAAVTEQERGFHFVTEKQFLGRVSRDGFKFKPVLPHIFGGMMRTWNPEGPIVVGRFTPGATGLRIAVTMRITYAAIAFLTFWTAAVTAVIIGGSVQHGGISKADLFGSLLTLILPTVVVQIRILFRSRMLKRRIETLFNAKSA